MGVLEGVEKDRGAESLFKDKMKGRHQNLRREMNNFTPILCLKVKKVKVLVAQVTSDSLPPHDYSPSDSSDHGISQAKILE